MKYIIGRHQKIRPVAGFALALLLVFASVYSTLLTSLPASAANAKDFNPANIIDNAVFRNNKSMSASQIQSFLNKKNSVCLKNYKGLSLIDANGNGQVEDWTKKERYGGSTGKARMSAAQLIKAASDIYKINPQVLLVTLQKEQGLITGTNCANMGTAFGYGCPDTAACDPAAMGFTRQLDNAAYHFKGYYQDSLPYVPFTKGTYTINYNPIAKCGGKKVTIQNEATAALYSYTPYQPNKYALDGGSDDSYPNCGAFGNRNFFIFFTDWFGSTKYTLKGSIKKYYDSYGGTTKLGEPIGNEKKIESGAWYQCFEKGCIIGTSKDGFWESKGPIRSRWAKLGHQDGTMGYPKSSITCTTSNESCYQMYQGGAIIWSKNTGAWESKGKIRARWGQLGYQNGKMGYPTGPEVRTKGGGYYQKYQNGYIVGNGSAGYWESVGKIRARWGQLGYQNGKMGYPTGPEVRTKDGQYQKYQKGYIVGTESTGYWESKGAIRKEWAKLKYENGKMGYPIGPETKTKNGWVQSYQHGKIYFENKKYRLVYN